MIPAHFSHLKDKFVTIVAFGDSLTAVNHWTQGHLNWAGYLSMGLFDVFKNGSTVINSGIGGNRLIHAAERLERDVLRYSPDIVIVCFGMNDCMHTRAEAFHQQLQDITQKIKASGANVILRTPNPVINMFSGKELTVLDLGNQDQPQTIDLESFTHAIVDVAEKEQCLLVDHYRLWKESMKSSCVGDMILLMANPQHPNHIGHRRLYHEIAPLFNAYPYHFHEWQRILLEQKAHRI